MCGILQIERTTLNAKACKWNNNIGKWNNNVGNWNVNVGKWNIKVFHPNVNLFYWSIEGRMTRMLMNWVRFLTREWRFQIKRCGEPGCQVKNLQRIRKNLHAHHATIGPQQKDRLMPTCVSSGESDEKKCRTRKTKCSTRRTKRSGRRTKSSVRMSVKILPGVGVGAGEASVSFYRNSF